MRARDNAITFGVFAPVWFFAYAMHKFAYRGDHPWWQVVIAAAWCAFISVLVLDSMRRKGG